MEKNNDVFIRCPRCELNYIKKKDKLCSICKKEVEAAFHKDDDFSDITLDLEICPICKVNYIREDEDICASCRKEREEEGLADDEIIEKDWEEDDDGVIIEPDEELGEMVNTIDVDAPDDLEIDDLDLDIPLSNDLEFEELADEDFKETDEVEEESEDDFDEDFDEDFDDLSDIDEDEEDEDDFDDDDDFDEDDDDDEDEDDEEDDDDDDDDKK